MAIKVSGKRSRNTRKEDRLEDLKFRPSPESTVGVELELQIIDRETRDLGPGAMRLLQASEAEEIPGVTAELLQSMVEIKSDVCRSVLELQAELAPQLMRLRTLANSIGYDLAMGGTHPFNRPETNAIFPKERYQRVHARMAWMASQIVVFGMHVHVGVASGDLAVRIINKLVQYVPHLLALSSNSPFWRGVDTGMASVRASLFRLAPHVSLPHYFPNWKEFTRYVEVMRRCGAVQNTKDVYWDIRPRPSLGTIEFRICDMPSSFAHVLAIASIIRSMVIGTQRALMEKDTEQVKEVPSYWIAAENKWLAARFGLEAQCIRTPRSKVLTLGEDIKRLMTLVRPIAKESGEEGFIDALGPLAEFETGSERQRRIYRESGEWGVVVEDMKDRWAKELEITMKREG